MHSNILQPSNEVSVAYLPAFLKSSLSVVSWGTTSLWFFFNSLACFTYTTAHMISQELEQRILCTITFATNKSENISMQDMTQLCKALK